MSTMDKKQEPARTFFYGGILRNTKSFVEVVDHRCRWQEAGGGRRWSEDAKQYSAYGYIRQEL